MDLRLFDSRCNLLKSGACAQRYIEAYQAKKEAEAKLKAAVKPAEGQDAAANGDQPTEDSLDDKVRPGRGQQCGNGRPLAGQ